MAVGSSAKILITNFAEGLMYFILCNSSSLSNVIKSTPAFVANLNLKHKHFHYIIPAIHLRWDFCLHGFAYMILDGSTPRSSTLRISLLLAQSKPVPRAARVCSNKGSSLHFTAMKHTQNFKLPLHLF